MSELPEGWAVSSLNNLIALNPKNDCADETEIGFVPMQLLGTQYKSKIGFERKKWGEVKKGYTHFADGDVLLAKITPCFENGKAGLVSGLPNGLGTGSTEYFVCRPHPDVLLPEYLLAFFKTQDFLRNGEVEMTGSVGHKRVPKDYLLQSAIPLPPLNEQKRIAAKLDALLQRVDACRARLERVPLLLKRFRQAVLAAATSGQLTEDWQEGESEWNEATIDEISELISGFAFKSEWFKSNGKHQVVKIANVKEGYLDLKAAPAFITYDLAKEYERFQAWPQDILISMTGTKYKQDYGFVGLAQPGMNIWVNQRVSIIRAKEGQINPEFLFLFLRSQEFRQQFFKGETGQVNQGNVGSNHIKSCQVRFPSMLKQAEIVRRVETLFAYADRLEARYQQARAEVERLTPALLAKAFRGELVPQDPNDEPASVLLEQLQAERAMITAKPKQRAASLNGKR